MTKIITAVIIIAALYGGWHLFLYWEKVKNEEEVQKKEAQDAIAGDSLPGLPYQLEASLQTARQQGATAMGTWLKNNSASLQDPRKAWIELDYVLLLFRPQLQHPRTGRIGIRRSIFSEPAHGSAGHGAWTAAGFRSLG